MHSITTHHACIALVKACHLQVSMAVRTALLSAGKKQQPIPCVWFGVVWVGLAPTLILGMAPTFVLFGCWVGFVPVSCLVRGLQRVGANPSLVWMNGLE